MMKTSVVGLAAFLGIFVSVIGCGESANKSIYVCSAWEKWCVNNTVWVCLGDGHHHQLLQTCSEFQQCVDGQCLTLNTNNNDVVADTGALDATSITDIDDVSDSEVVDLIVGTTDVVGRRSDVGEPTDWGTVQPKDIAPDDPFPSDVYPLKPPIWVEMWNDDRYFDAMWSLIPLQDTRLAIAAPSAYAIRIFDLKGNFLEAWVPPEGPMPFQPQFIAQGEDGVVWATEVRHNVVRFSPTGEFLGVWNASGTDASDPKWSFGGIAIEKAGTILLTDPDRGQVVRFSETGQLLKIIAQFGDQPGMLDGGLRGVRVAPNGTIFVVLNPALVLYSPDGTYLGSFVAPPGEPPLSMKTGIFFDNGYIYVSGGDSGRLYVLDEALTVLSAWGAGKGIDANKYFGAWDIAVGADQRIYVADTWNRRVQVYQWAVQPP